MPFGPLGSTLNSLFRSRFTSAFFRIASTAWTRMGGWWGDRGTLIVNRACQFPLLYFGGLTCTLVVQNHMTADTGSLTARHRRAWIAANPPLCQ